VRETAGLKAWELEDEMAVVSAYLLVRETAGLKDWE
jgi:hypothetical protein